MAEGGEMLQEREVWPPCATGHRQRVRAYGPPGAKSPDGDLGAKGRLGVQDLGAPGRVDAAPGQWFQSPSDALTLLPTHDVSLSLLCATHTFQLPEHRAKDKQADGEGQWSWYQPPTCETKSPVRGR